MSIQHDIKSVQLDIKLFLKHVCSIRLDTKSIQLDTKSVQHDTKFAVICLIIHLKSQFPNSLPVGEISKSQKNTLGFVRQLADWDLILETAYLLPASGIRRYFLFCKIVSQVFKISGNGYHGSIIGAEFKVGDKNFPATFLLFHQQCLL